MKRTIRPVLAVLAVLLAASIVPEQASAQDRLKLSTIVIDPGHGGHDPGCISADKKPGRRTWPWTSPSAFPGRSGSPCRA